MSVDELRTVLERLRTAHDLADGEDKERIGYIIERVETAVDEERTLDHGTLARMTRKLAEVAEEGGGELAEAIDAAAESISTYREGVEGV
jgi:hypothetical protein